MPVGLLPYLAARQLVRNYRKNSNPTNQSHDDYMNQVKDQLSGSDYAELLKSAPFIDDYGDPTIWDKIGNALNIHTAEDKYRIQQQQAQRDAAFQLLTNKREEEYNSESSIASRMRAAGQNPDLLGTEGGSEASEYTEPDAMPDYQLDTLDKSVQSFTSTIVDSLLGGIQMVGSIASTRGQILNNEGQELTNFLTAIQGSSDLADLVSPSNPDGEYNLYDIMTAVSDAFMGKKSAKKFRSVVRGFAPSAKATAIINRNADDALQARFDYMKKQNNIFYQEAQKVASPVIERLVQLENDVYVKQLELFKAEAEGNKEYLDNFDFRQSAESQNAENRVAKEYNEGIDAKTAAELTNKTNRAELLSQDVKMMMNKAYHDIVNSLYKQYQEEKNFKGKAAQAGLIGMSVISTLIANGGAAQMISAAIPRSSSSTVRSSSDVSSRSESHSYNENYNYNMTAGQHR